MILQKLTLQQLTILLDAKQPIELNEFDFSQDEAIAPRFLLEFAAKKLSKDPINLFWWSPRLIVVDKKIVGTIGFKQPPTVNGRVEIGYGIISSQQGRGFATEAVNLLLKEAFSVTEIQAVIAHTDPSNRASQRVLEKNKFIKVGSNFEPEDGEVWVWQKKRTEQLTSEKVA